MADRPTVYTPGIRDHICSTVEVSQCGMRKMCNDDPSLPSYSTLTSWLRIYDDLASQYAAAKRIQVNAMADDIVDISQDDSIDPSDKRIRVDTLKWLLSKLIPRTYGDKLDVTSDGQALAVPSHQIDARIQSIIMQAQVRKAGGVEDVVSLPPEALKLLE